ncbi:outer membrane protein assembly factor BamD [Tenacibaculum haliotis]|uniref:outer membrane protein assembly factor BamD n=1 Tax=Tenacibaculum haliotis TaxID=1888914 RepID=UPI0021B01A5F|nr:outer membrane protein assembly factor BamD [Tenacibaculum haliotis]MCT4699403.1 outer membrane protein assembly factor BamD [Tenacibaculum haliotis]
MKNLAYLVVMLLILSSCGEYNKVLNKGTIQEQYKMATKMYETQKYSKALRLFEKITPSYRGKPQMERIQYMVSQSNFNEKDYSLAGYYFNRFTKNYPKSSKREEAAFLSALSYYKAAPKFSLDPTDTNKALASFQSFIDKYPNSDKQEEANKYYTELRNKLEKKAFEIAKTYYNTAGYDSRNYSAAIAAFDNLLEDYLGTKYKEEALYFRLKAAHDFVLKSTQRRKAERIETAVKAYDKLKRSFPESKFMKESNEMLATLNKEQEQLVKS